MREIKRYEIEKADEDLDNIFGEWVRFEDHAAIVAALQEQVRALAAEKELSPPAVLPQGDVAKALRDCDWSGVSIGNKAIIQAAIEALGAAPQTPILLQGGRLREDGKFWYDADTIVGIFRKAGIEVKP